jgi:hypothetical protein
MGCTCSESSSGRGPTSVCHISSLKVEKETYIVKWMSSLHEYLKLSIKATTGTHQRHRVLCKVVQIPKNLPSHRPQRPSQRAPADSASLYLPSQVGTVDVFSVRPASVPELCSRSSRHSNLAGGVSRHMATRRHSSCRCGSNSSYSESGAGGSIGSI